MGRAGLNRKTAYATLALTLAAEAPDLDVFWELGGPVAGLQHHRGISHTLLGAPFMALAVTGVVWCWHRFRKKEPKQPIKWFWVWAFSLLSSLVHILLDFTNNYGVRPFYPFNPRWYSGDIVFIFEPLIFLLLLLALVMPWLLGLADKEIGVKKTPFVGQKWAITALLGVVATWSFRTVEHSRAKNLALNGGFTSDPVTKIALEPYPINPFHWAVIVETPAYFQQGEVNTQSDQVITDSRADVIYKPEVTPAVMAAKQSYLGQVYLDWSQFPYVQEIGPSVVTDVAAPAPKGDWTTVEFKDLRFAYPSILLRDPKNPPLSAWVYVQRPSQVLTMIYGGRVQK